MEVLVVAALLGLITGAIAQSKGRSFFMWWLYGTAIFIVALPHILLSKDQSGKRCSQCREYIDTEAKICRYCQTPQ